MFTLVRWAVAYVFIISGIMKLVSTDLANTFMQLRLPFPEQLMTVIAVVEILCGTLILINKGARLASIPLMGIMVAALMLTKIPLFSSGSGVMQFAFAARLDIVMLLLLFVLYDHRGKVKE